MACHVGCCLVFANSAAEIVLLAVTPHAVLARSLDSGLSANIPNIRLLVYARLLAVKYSDYRSELIVNWSTDFNARRSFNVRDDFQFRSCLMENCNLGSGYLYRDVQCR